MSTGDPGERVTVAAVMRRHFITAAPEDSLPGVRQTMRLARLRHLVIARGDRLVGLLSYRELTDALLDEGDGPAKRSAKGNGSGKKAANGNGSANGPANGHGTISSAMVANPTWVTPDTLLSEAADRLCRYGFGCLPVVDELEPEPRVVGLVTETDLLRVAFRGAGR